MSLNLMLAVEVSDFRVFSVIESHVVRVPLVLLGFV